MKKVIKFYADWCGPCKLYAPIFDKVSEELKDEAEFVNVNIEEDTTGLAAEFKVQAIPTTVIINEGVEKSKTGRLEEADLRNFILNE